MQYNILFCEDVITKKLFTRSFFLLFLPVAISGNMGVINACQPKFTSVTFVILMARWMFFSEGYVRIYCVIRHKSLFLKPVHLIALMLCMSNSDRE